MAWGTLTSIGTNESGAGSATLAVTVPVGGVPAGALIVVIVGEGSGTVGGSMTDTAGNTYTAVGGKLNSLSSGFIQAFWAYNVAALVSANTITYTKQTSGDRTAMTAFYDTGEQTSSSPLDTSVTATASGASTSPSVTSGAPSIAGDLIIAAQMAMGTNSDTLTIDATYSTAPPTNVRNSGGGTTSNPQVGAGYVIEAGTSARAYTGTITSRSWAALIIGFQVAVVATDTLFAQACL